MILVCGFMAKQEQKELIFYAKPISQGNKDQKRFSFHIPSRLYALINASALYEIKINAMPEKKQNKKAKTAGNPGKNQ